MADVHLGQIRIVLIFFLLPFLEELMSKGYTFGRF